MTDYGAKGGEVRRVCLYRGRFWWHYETSWVVERMGGLVHFMAFGAFRWYMGIFLVDGIMEIFEWGWGRGRYWLVLSLSGT